MGDISIIARRLEDGHVQYGWSGNGGYYKVVGIRLLLWYLEPEDVEYLFGLGQTALIGKRGSEYGGYRWIETHDLTGEPFWLDYSERSIFSRIVFIDYGYFYDLDHKWYYIIPGPFRIKMPLELIDQNVDERNFEFDFCIKVQDKILRYILGDYREKNPEFAEFLNKEGYCVEDILENISEDGLLSVMEFYHKYRTIFDYFDDWILIKTNEENYIKKMGGIECSALEGGCRNNEMIEDIEKCLNTKLKQEIYCPIDDKIEIEIIKICNNLKKSDFYKFGQKWK